MAGGRPRSGARTGRPHPGELSFGSRGRRSRVCTLEDLRYSFRILLKNPGFAAVSLVCLALRIGATSAIFSVVNAVMLRPLPYSHPEQ
jgi:hypothetical protein